MSKKNAERKRQEKQKKSWKRAIVAIVLLLLAAPGALYVYESRSAEAGLTTASFRNPDGTVIGPLKLKIARTEEERRRGLMYQKDNISEEKGMLFIFPQEKKRSFWMKNTFVPLDMFFLDDSLKVVGIIHNVPVLNSKKRGVDAPSQYVVELLGGAAKKKGILEGAVLETAAKLPKAE